MFWLVVVLGSLLSHPVFSQTLPLGFPEEVQRVVLDPAIRKAILDSTDPYSVLPIKIFLKKGGDVILVFEVGEIYITSRVEVDKNVRRVRSCDMWVSDMETFCSQLESLSFKEVTLSAGSLHILKILFNRSNQPQFRSGLLNVVMTIGEQTSQFPEAMVDTMAERLCGEYCLHFLHQGDRMKGLPKRWQVAFLINEELEHNEYKFTVDQHSKAFEDLLLESERHGFSRIFYDRLSELFRQILKEGLRKK